MKNPIHKILKIRKVAVSTIFEKPVITYAVILFSTFTIGTFKN